MVVAAESHESLSSDKTKCSENGGLKGMIVRRNNVQFQCHDIAEPEAGNELTGHKEYMNSILATFQQSLERSKLNLGYPLNYDYDYSALGGLPNFVMNNFGDPFIECNYYGHSKQFEVGVLDWFARLWEIDRDEYWGYVTNGGTEANLHAILLGRELFPDGILYTSKESHFSIFKAARMYRMKCVKVETLISGVMDCVDFKTKLLLNKDKPAIVNVTLGTTMKGAIDDLDLVIQTLEECGFEQDRFYIHCDGAMYGLMLPLLEEGPRITFKKPIGSISVSGHKFIGCTMPCGIQMTRIKHINVVSRDVEYIASRDISISCSRNGHSPIYLWYALSQKGYRGFQHDFEKCLSNAKYLKQLLMEAGVSVMLNELSSIVVFERPPDEEFIRRWQLSCEGNIAHVIVMPNCTVEKLDTFYQELVKKRVDWFEDGGDQQPPCVALQIGNGNCVCPTHKSEIL